MYPLERTWYHQMERTTWRETLKCQNPLACIFTMFGDEVWSFSYLWETTTNDKKKNEHWCHVYDKLCIMWGALQVWLHMIENVCIDYLSLPCEGHINPYISLFLVKFISYHGDINDEEQRFKISNQYWRSSLNNGSKKNNWIAFVLSPSKKFKNPQDPTTCWILLILGLFIAFQKLNSKKKTKRTLVKGSVLQSFLHKFLQWRERKRDQSNNNSKMNYPDERCNYHGRLLCKISNTNGKFICIDYKL